MPKIIETTVKIEVQCVSCPGVWLCQNGRVSLTLYALDTSYQTCLLPPVFPLLFRDVFYFRKRFRESCDASNISCLLKDEALYCELVQWSDDCLHGGCYVLAQYLGSLKDVLFPPNMCSTDGVDLLMRRGKKFPGILAPKIEIATKVRIDEMSNTSPVNSSSKTKRCCCSSSAGEETNRQKQVCHSSQYHRTKCNACGCRSRSRSRSGSRTSRSWCSLKGNQKQSNRNSPSKTCCYCGLEAQVTKPTELPVSPDVEQNSKVLLESRYIDQNYSINNGTKKQKCENKLRNWSLKPCVCEICERYHDLFHINDWKG